MTIRQYAESVGFQIVGKLTRKVDHVDRYNPKKGNYETVSTIYWEDEAGNEYTKGCIITADGRII